ncbi:MAG: hypothetical protein EOO91_10985 [Pedobacter sp.]|nr:MAG: hypothetical protein EOO91_10985 [Pedobacter sp.]
MKKLLSIAIVLCTMSCSIMGYSTPKYTIGMTEQEFVKLNKSPQKVLADNTGLSIYRTSNGLQSMYAFFAFDRGKLIRFEEGSNADDYKFIRL